MRSVTIEPSGEVVIRCSLEEAMAQEIALVSFKGDPEVNRLISGVWDELDELRVKLMATNPDSIPEYIRAARIILGRRR